MTDPNPAGRHRGGGQQPYDRELAQLWRSDGRASLGTFLLADLPGRRERERSSEGGWRATHPGIDRHDISVDRPDGAITLSLFRRDTSDHTKPRAAVYFIHGGGMMVGDSLTGIELVLDWVSALDVVCFSVEYRLAPEHPDPVPVEDCYAGLAWLLDNTESWGIDPDRILVCGVSAGGGLAAGTVLLARDRKLPALLGQVLVCPMLDDRNDTASALQFADNEFWDRRSNATGWQALLGDRAGGDRVSPYSAPARARDVVGLPSTFVDVGSAELFRDEAIDYASLLLEAGVPVELHVWPGAFHEFDALYPDAALSIAATAARTGWVRRLLGGAENHAE